MRVLPLQARCPCQATPWGTQQFRASASISFDTQEPTSPAHFSPRTSVAGPPVPDSGNPGV
uniref:Macaca fascicularis brain cDNA clone: QflA-23759, similar to human protein predicted by clone 23882 (HSU79303), mRNA, RefSeq: NM_013301.1 n=1 Tax=Macaca fascicularis TaxID=9541 RepID=I7GMV2_MACFA|nr:unnamed protein product [Macaca fascicularis]